MATSKQSPRRFPSVPAEAYLIGAVVILTGVMLNHVSQYWSESPNVHTTNAKTGITFTHNFTGDRLADTGHWRPQTSAMNFCEEDYIVTPTIAEFVNTLSNVSYIYFAWSTWPKKARWPPMMNVSLFLVGLTSAFLHATLKHYTQIADETSMYLLTASIDWNLYSYPGAIFSGRVAKPVFTTSLWAACALVVYINFTAGGADFGIHTMLFISLLTALWPRCLYLLAERRRLEREGTMKKGTTSAAALRNRFKVGASCFLLGFGLWLVDCAFCYELRAFRERIGMPFAWFTEMHAWWHVLTALGAEAFVNLANVFSSEDDGNIKVPVKHKGAANGVAKQPT